MMAIKQFEFEFEFEWQIFQCCSLGPGYRMIGPGFINHREDKPK